MINFIISLLLSFIRLFINKPSKLVKLWDESKLSQPSKLLKYNVHDCYQNLSQEKVKNISTKYSLPCCLMLYNLTGDINIGMAIRTAAIFGCSDVYVVGKKHYDKRSEVGASNYINIHRYETFEPQLFEKLNLIPIIVEQGGIPMEEFSFFEHNLLPHLLPHTLPHNTKCVFIVGSEDCGFSSKFLKSMRNCKTITISQYGVMRSLNVGVAASIVLYEYMRQYRKYSLSII